MGTDAARRTAIAKRAACSSLRGTLNWRVSLGTPRTGCYSSNDKYSEPLTVQRFLKLSREVLWSAARNFENKNFRVHSRVIKRKHIENV